MPSTCAPMIGNTWWPAWCWWSTTTAPVSVITPTITRERRLAREQRRDHARAPHDLAQRRRRRRRAAVGGVQQLGDRARVGAHAQRRGRAPTSMKPPAASHSIASASPSSVAAVEQRAEHERAEDRAEHGAEQHERDPVRAPLGRVHVARRGAREQRRPARGADADEARPAPREPSRPRCRARRARSRRPDHEPEREHGHAADAVHRAPGGQRGQRARGEHDRGPSPSSPSTPTTETSVSEATAADELQRARVGGQRRRQQQRCCGGCAARHASSRCGRLTA